MTTLHTTLVNVTLSVFNEAARLPGGLVRLRRFVSEHCRFRAEVVIVDNASTEGTFDLARQLSRQWEGTRVVRLHKKGRGRALKHARMESRADVLSYMDIDLSTDLAAFGPLAEGLVLDRFCVLNAYQCACGVLAIFAFPGSMLPGPLKLVAAVIQGVFHDLGFSLLRRFPRGRVFASAVLGGLLSKAVVMVLRVKVLGLPWTGVTQALLGIQTVASILLNCVAAAVALAIWSRIRNLQITRMLRVQP